MSNKRAWIKMYGVCVLSCGMVCGNAHSLPHDPGTAQVTQSSLVPTEHAVHTTHNLSDVLESTTPAIVNIAIVGETSSDFWRTRNQSEHRQFGFTATGSGVVYDSVQGHIITNAHILEHQKIIFVTLKNGRRYRAQLVGTSKDFDIAVLQIKAQHLVALPISDSETLKIGDSVVAIGSPFGLSQTVTAGVVSALNRSQPEFEGFQNFIQTDASINFGNSGGALMNLSGQLVGINTAILSPNSGNVGIGFAIPSNIVRSVAQQLIQYGQLKPGFLGVVAQNVTSELAEALHIKNNCGVVITQIVEESPAHHAHMRVEDVITHINKISIHDSSQLRSVIGSIRSGTKAQVHIVRNGRPYTIEVVMGDPNAPLKTRVVPYLAGLRLQDFNDLESNGRWIHGVLVLDVEDTSAGALAGIAPGDIILKAGAHEVDSLSALADTAVHTHGAFLLTIMRGNTNMLIVIEPDQ